MAKVIEVLDALPGCGKTTAIFDYMSTHQDEKWLYLSPLLSEVDERVLMESDRTGIAFVTPVKSNVSKSSQLLEFLQEGKNIACTHSLALNHFSKDHIDLIALQGYNVVCDEELQLIDAYNISSDDINFLYSKGLLRKDSDNLGRMYFTDKEMSYGTRYGDIKRLCDRGCLYGEKNSDTMLVTYLSPDLVLCSQRFILLTYNFGDGVMDAFMNLHGVKSKPFELDKSLHKDNLTAKEEIKKLISIHENKALKEFLRNQNIYTLSSTWWKTQSETRNKQKKSVKNLMTNLPRNAKISSNDVFYTVPVDSITEIKGRNITNENHVPYNCRSTNNYRDKTYAIHAYNIYSHVTVKSYLKSYGYEVDDDITALNHLIQWLFRGCIRDRKPMKVSFLSSRMKSLFSAWLEDI